MSGLMLMLAGALWGLAPQAPEPAPRRATAQVLTLREAVAEALRASPALQPAQDAVEIAAIQDWTQSTLVFLRPSYHDKDALLEEIRDALAPDA